MKKIRILSVHFTNSIKPWELKLFRGAIIKKAGSENILFHNHLSDKEFLYGYPVIQYKYINNRPVIYCVDYGTDEVHHVFKEKNLKINIGERIYELIVDKIQLNKFNVQIWEKSFSFLINNWLALNQQNYINYQKISDQLEKIEFLENILKANILSFAKGIKWEIDKTIKIRILEVKKTKLISYKDSKLMSFDIAFLTNVSLPEYIGLGKGISLGFGIVTHATLKKDENKS